MTKPNARASRAWIGVCAAVGIAAGAPSPYRGMVVPTAMTVPSEWKYVTADPGAGWEKPGFADTGWAAGLSGFGTRTTPGAAAGTPWSDSDIWLRRTVSLPDPDSLPDLALLVHHDEDAEVYVNGTLVWSDTGFTTDYKSYPLGAEDKAAFKAGDNLLAVHCHQTKGGQFIDVGLEAGFDGTAATLLADARDPAAKAWRYTTDDPQTSAWSGAAFNDSAWSTGKGGFGTSITPGLVKGTEWSGSDIWLRTAFTMDSAGYDHYILSLDHDEDVLVVINGKPVLQRVGYVKDYVELDVTATAAPALKPGRNVIAIWCHNNGGGQAIDAGLKGIREPATVALRPSRAGLVRRGKGFRSGPQPVWPVPGSGREARADGRAVR